MKKALLFTLVAALLLSLSVPALAFSAQLSAQKLSVNGKDTACEKYNIDGNNYFKLRDLAKLLNGTGSQFDVGWDAAKSVVSITTAHAYTTPDGHELETGTDKSSTAKVSSQTIMINGAVRTDLTVYNIGGSNFFKLREMGDALGFEVGYDSASNTATVKSKEAQVKVTITLDKSSLSLSSGEKAKLNATVTPAGTKITWSSGNTAIATVDADGNVTAVKGGTADISASAGNGKAVCTVTVKEIKWYGEGSYLVGTDIPAGDYYAVTTSSSTGYYCKYTDTTKNKIEANDIFASQTFFRAYDGQLLKISSCKIASIAMAPVLQPDSNGVYKEGAYRVGTDIPAGDYYAVATSSSTGYYCKYDDITKNHIEANDVFSTQTFFRAYDGQILKLSDCKIMPMSKAPVLKPSSNGAYGEGMYRVGVDMPAGEYRITQTDKNHTGYYCAYDDITQKHIADNDIFDGTTYYTVKSGQFFKLSGCTAVSTSSASASTGGGTGSGSYSQISESTGKTVNDLVSYIKTNGNVSQSDGTRYIYKTNKEKDHAQIVYNEGKNQLEFLYIATVVSTSSTTSISASFTYDITSRSAASKIDSAYTLIKGKDILSFSGKADFDISTYTSGKALSYKFSDYSALTDSEASGTLDTTVAAAVASWSILMIEQAKVTPTDIGFLAY